MTEQRIETPPEKTSDLVLLFVPPAIWAVHFLLSYATAAVWCARFAGRDGELGPARTAIACYTVVALTGIVIAGWSGLRRHGHGTEIDPHDSDTPGDRTRFLGFATMLLAGLSAVSTAFVAMMAIFVDRCV